MAQADERARLRRWRGMLFYVVGLAALWLALLRGCAAVCDVRAKPVWTAASGQPAPENDFRFIAFPNSNAVPLYDASENPTAGVLTRAVPLSIDAEQHNWFILAEGQRVKRADLTLVPPDGWEAWLDAYGKAREARDKSFLFAKVRSGPLADGATRVTFEEHGDDWMTASTYLVRGGRGQPHELSFLGRGAGIEMGVRALVAIPLMLAVGLIGGRLLRRALLGKPVAST